MVRLPGNQSNKLYYYGLLLTADDYKYQVATVENHDFIINSNGSIQHSFDTSYKEDGDTLITVEAKGAAAYEEDGQYKYGFTKGVTSKVSDVDLNEFYNAPATTTFTLK